MDARKILVLPIVLALAGCGSEPANVAGSYTVNVTNGPNGCMTDGWTEGESSTGTAVLITQEGSEVTIDVQGATGTLLDVVYGTSEFVGTVSGDHVDARLTGRAGGMGSCAYTSIVDLDADLDGDLLTGTLRYYDQTNGLEECGIRNTCSNTQSFNGTRPPGS